MWEPAAAMTRTPGADPLLGGTRTAEGQVSWLRLIAPRPSRPLRDSGTSGSLADTVAGPPGILTRFPILPPPTLGWGGGHPLCRMCLSLAS